MSSSKGRPLLIWTRARADWAADQPLLQALGGSVEVLHLPCLELKALPITVPAGRWDYLVFSSAHAVDFAWHDAALRQAAHAAIAVYTHGMATAERLAALGRPATLLPGLRTAQELTAHLLSTLPPNSRVLVPGAAAPAFDIAAALSSSGHAAAAVACYATDAEARHSDGRPLSAADVRTLTASLRGCIAFASPSAVRGFRAVFTAPELRLALRALCLGPTTAQTARQEFAAVDTAASNDLEALVALIRQSAV